MKKIILLFVAVSIFGCQSKRSHDWGGGKYHKVSRYTTHQTNSLGVDDVIFWYIILGSNNHYYYYSSTVEVSNYSSISSWTPSTTNPVANYDSKDIQPMPDEVIAEEDLSQEMQQQMTDNAEYFEGMTEEEMGDYEGTTSFDGDNNSESTSSENSSSDAGSSDSGGGDSGGGDGG